MSSILTNNGAMVALQALRNTNMNLEKTQNAISSGRDISTAKDNSAIWAISKVMGSDASGFKAISASLSLAESTTAVASAAAEQIVGVLTDIKGAMGEDIDSLFISGGLAAAETKTDVQPDPNALSDYLKKEMSNPTYTIGFLR